MSDSEFIEKLGFGLRKTSLRGPYTVGDRAGTHEAIKNRIITIPGHAEFFGSKISTPYAAIKQDYADGKDTGEIGWSGYMRDSMEAFITLSMLPSPETVRVLGEMLSDDWEWPGYEKDNFFGTMDTRALSSLSKLPIANLPTRKLHTDADMREFLDDWKEWYAEIKSGERAFSFKGQAVEYRFNPDGTWKTIPIANPPDDGPKTPERNAPVPTPETQPTPDQNPENPVNGGVIYLLAAMTVFLAAIAVYFGKRHFSTKH